MLGRMALWDGGRGFGVDRDEQAAAEGRETLSIWFISIASASVHDGDLLGLQHTNSIWFVSLTQPGRGARM